MDIIEATRMTIPFITKATLLPDVHPEYGKDHLYCMCDKIVAGEVTEEKAHRWLGWVQGCICVGGGAGLDSLKQINGKT